MVKLVYFLDIDDCLIKTTTLTDDHRIALKEAFQKLGVNKVHEIISDFCTTYSLLYSTHQGKKLSLSENNALDIFKKRLTQLEKFIIEEYGEIKIWSREAALYISAEKYGITLSNSYLSYLSNTLWDKISQTATFYPDTLPFLTYLGNNNIPFYLISASDCRLTLDEKSGYFDYDPIYSRKLKLKRLKLLYHAGINEKQIFVGDPYDKPNPWVFRQALKKAKKDNGDHFTAIMIGDSVKNDLLPAKKAGMDKLFWLKRNEGSEVGTDDIVILNSFQVLIDAKTHEISDKIPV